MFNTYCMICTDKNKFRMVVDEANRIAHRLREITYKYNKIGVEADKSECMRLQGSIPNFNSMCGHCPDINEMELINAERGLVEVIVEIKVLLKREDLEDKYKKSLKHNAFDCLRGFYPSLASYLKTS